jgi:hypothetical protein
MNPRTLFLAGSVLANVAFAAAFVIRPTLAPPAIRDFFESDKSRAARAANSHQAQSNAERARLVAEVKADAANHTRLWSALQSDDLRALIGRLRAAGFPAGVVRAVVSAEVDERFSARIKALRSQIEETPYWQPAPTSSFNNPKFFEERQQAYRDRARLMRDLLGDQALAGAGIDPTEIQRQQFGDLSKDKIELVQRINEDYAEMASQVRAATNGIMLPEDRAKLALLEREKRADLASVLTPQQLEDYEMRTSPITMRLRSAMTFMDATEAEFRTIYRVNLPFADVLHPNIGDRMTGYSPELRAKREEATQTVAAQLKAALGDARYAELARAQNYDFQQLARLTQNANIPLTAAIRAFDLRTSTSEASARIGDNPALSVDQKVVALRELAQTTKTQLSAALGPAAANAYAQSAIWLQAIEKGHVVQFSADGMSTSTRPVSSSSPPPPR